MLPMRAPSQATSEELRDHEGRRRSCRHEGRGGRDRTPRRPRNAADTVTTGAAAAKSGAEADKKTCNHERRRRAIQRDCEIAGIERPQHGPADEQSQHEGCTPGPFVFLSSKQSAHDATDAGYAAQQRQRRGCRETNQNAAEQRTYRCEVFHGVCLRPIRNRRACSEPGEHDEPCCPGFSAKTICATSKRKFAAILRSTTTSPRRGRPDVRD